MKILDTIITGYYIYLVYEIIRRIITVERKMKIIDDKQEEDKAIVSSVGASRFTIERKIIDDDIDKKQNNMRYQIYKKISLSIILTVLPFLIKYIYMKKTNKEFNSITLTIISFGINFLVCQIIDIELTKEELDFADI